MIYYEKNSLEIHLLAYIHDIYNHKLHHFHDTSESSHPDIPTDHSALPPTDHNSHDHGAMGGGQKKVSMLLESHSIAYRVDAYDIP